jgi:hypothetical protein
MPFMTRNAEDDYDALLMINAMESVGATVVTLTPRGLATTPGALAQHVQLTVWARVPTLAFIKLADDAIEAAFDHNPQRRKT